ncbi:MAG: hypothetical protein ONB42_00960 [candidate division KSB1 bacterium]|nr:hypothetical protein [candidate division KSB1 bacterium]
MQKLYLFLLGILMIPSPFGFAQIISLDGEWQFAVDASGAFHIGNVKEKAGWRIAKVPLSWQAQFEDLRDYQGVAWYRKSFELPKLKSPETAILRFGAVDYVAEVFLNGHNVGRHEGGYTPFEFDIRRFAKAGTNELLVRVMDPVPTEIGTEGVSYWHIPHGKQNWYVQTSGLWQSVSVVIKPRRHIRQIHLTPTIDGKIVVEVNLSLGENKKSNEQLSLRIFDPQKREVLQISKMLLPSEEKVQLEGVVHDPLLWSFDSPHLYEAELSLGANHKVVERFGFRSLAVKNKLLYFNGEPFYMMAALDQDFYPETIYTTPSEEYLRDEMLKAKRLGLNMLRCHIKVPDPRYLKVADDVGLLVWYEIPNWDVLTPEAARRADETLEAMLDRDWNHPSVVIISLINESWGIDLKRAEQRQWLLSAFSRAKQKAVGRLIVDNSACWGNFHLKTDLNDYHTYWAIPENRHRFDQTLEDIVKRPKWLFSEFGDGQETGNEPLLLSEFGNWGLPKLPESLPWWFERDFGGREVTLPEGVQQRFKDFHYDEIFGTYNELAAESQRAQFMALKYEIEQIRLKPEIQGYVITEFTDINWECNGLLDMWRNMKIYADDLANIQQPDVIIPRPVKYNYWDDETVEIKLWLSHYSAVDLKNAMLQWTASSGEQGSFAVPFIDRTRVEAISSMQIPLTEIPSPQRLRITLALKLADGKVLAKNYCDVFVYPKRKLSAANPVRIYDPAKTLDKFTEALHTMGYVLDKLSAQRSPLVTNVLDQEILKHLQRGETVLCLVDTNTHIPAGFPFSLTSRNAEWYDGNWASNFNWVRRDHGPFRDLSFEKFLGFESALVSPATVITGISAANFSDVLVGMYVGWLHLNSAYVLQMNAGQGRLILCTMRIAENFAHDAYAATLLDGLFAYSRSQAFTPQFTVKIE